MAEEQVPATVKDEVMRQLDDGPAEMATEDHLGQPFTPAQLERARTLGLPPSHDVLDPTHSDLHAYAADVTDEASAVEHAKRVQRQVRIPNGPNVGKFARVDGSIGPFQRP
jgi:hypothetical protein